VTKKKLQLISIILIVIVFSIALGMTIRQTNKALESRVLSIMVDSEKNLTAARNRLVQNRLNWLALSRINPSGVQFNFSRVDIIQKLSLSQSEDLEWIESRPKRERVFEFGSSLLNNYNNKFLPLRNEVYNAHRDNIKKQIEALENIKTINSTADKLLGYFPEQDLAIEYFSNLPDGRDKFIGRIKNTRSGIEKVNLEIKSLSRNLDISKFDTAFNLVSSNLEELEGIVLKRNSLKGLDMKSTVESINNLKLETHRLTINTITSNQMLAVLAEQANIIQAYNKLLANIKTNREESVRKIGYTHYSKTASTSSD